MTVHEDLLKIASLPPNKVCVYPILFKPHSWNYGGYVVVMTAHERNIGDKTSTIPKIIAYSKYIKRMPQVVIGLTKRLDEGGM